MGYFGLKSLKFYFLLLISGPAFLLFPGHWCVPGLMSVVDQANTIPVCKGLQVEGWCSCFSHKYDLVIPNMFIHVR